MNFKQMITGITAVLCLGTGGYGQTELIQNGDFTGTGAPWIFELYGGAATGSVSNNEYMVSITQTSDTVPAWTIVLHQCGFAMTNGHAYQLSYIAHASSNREIYTEINALTGTRRRTFWNNINLTTSKQRFTQTFIMTEPTYSSFCLEFECARSTPTVYLDSVSLKEVTGVPALGVTYPNGGEQLKPDTTIAITWLTASIVSNVKIDYSRDSGFTWQPIVASTPNTGTYNWTVPKYVGTTRCVVRVSEASTGTPWDRSNEVFTITGADTAVNLVKNGDFSQGQSGDNFWTSAFTSPAQGMGSVVNGEYNMVITNVGSSEPYAQLFQTGIYLLTGQAYEFSFDAYAFANKQITVQLQNYPFSRKYSINTSVQLTTIKQNFVFTFLYTDTANFKNDLRFQGGLTETDFYIDNVKLRAVNRDFLQISWPNGGQAWSPGTLQSISWYSSGSITNVKLEYSIDSGSTWKNIIASTPNTGTYSWTIPNDPSTRCLCRISDAADGTPADTSDAKFTLLPLPAITVTSPNGGETWLPGSSHYITWTTVGTVGNLKIEYTTDNGSTWTVIDPLTSNDGVYTWTVPSTLSTQCKVRVTDASGSPTDMSNAVFSIVPTITVTSPNGGETWYTGSSNPITWTNAGFTGNVNIDYSTNNGSTWTSVASNIGNTGTYSWTVPSTPSTSCKVRVSDASTGTPTDMSNAVFTITSGSLSVQYPNGRELFAVGAQRLIAWNSAGSVGNIKLEYSTDSGVTWKSIATSVANTGRYDWTVPNDASARCKVRASDAADGDPVDVSDSVFSIVTSVDFPADEVKNGDFGTGTTSWGLYTATAGAATGSVVNGEYFIDIVNSSGAYTWYIYLFQTGLQLIQGEQYVLSFDAYSSRQRTIGVNMEMPPSYTIHVSEHTVPLATAKHTYVTSFTMTQPGDTAKIAFLCAMDSGDVYIDNVKLSRTSVATSIAVTSPNGGEAWIPASSHNITWTSTGSIANVKIEYTSNNGTSWNTVVASTPNTGTYAWTIPSVSSTQCKVRVSDASGGTPSDASDAMFTIGNSITVTSPNGGENWAAGSSQNIAWTTTGTVGNVKIDYSTDNGSTWNEIVASTSNTGTRAWTVPAVASTQCKVRISDALSGTPSDASDAVFTINNTKTITVTSPNGGETWVAGSTHDITWTSTGGVGNVKIEYSSDNGSTWNEIVAGTSNSGTRSWTLPYITSSQCKVRVGDALTGIPSDESNAVFTIATVATITVVAPNGGETWVVGDKDTVKWTTTGTLANVRILYSTNNGTDWYTLVSSTPNTGAYPWQVTDIPSAQCRIMVFDPSVGTPTDQSDTTFTIIRPQSVIAKTGWNMVSFNMQPKDSSCTTVFGVLRGNVLVKNNAGQTYWPAYGINTIGSVATGQGYKLYTDTLDTIVISGQPYTVSATPISLSAGWNMTAYLPQASMSITTALTGIASQITIVKNNAGLVYWPDYSVNTIGTMNPGEGYKVCMKQAATLTYPSGGFAKKAAVADKSIVLPLAKHYALSKNTGASATILATNVLMNGVPAPDGAEVGAYEGDGNLVGSGVVMKGVTAFSVWGDDPQTKDKDGLAPAEAIVLKVWDGADDYELDMETKGRLTYNDDAIMMGKFLVPEKFFIKKFAMHSVYPNPFRGMVRIAFDVPYVKGRETQNLAINVYSISGRLVEKIASGQYGAGHYTISWNGAGTGAGLYIVQMKAAGYENRMRLVKVRY